MSDGLRVTIAGLDFFGQGQHDYVIDPDGFEGWDDGVDMRLQDTARPQAHGSFDLPGFQDARTVAISGHVLADSPRKLAALRSRLTGLLAGGALGRIQVERFGETQWADGRLASKTMFTERGGQNVASFQIQLWCADPRKFGELRAFDVAPGTPAQAFHRGNYAATPVIQVNGPLTGGFTITHPNGQFVVLGDLGSSSWVRVDMNTGRLKLNGNDRSDLVTRADVCTVPPGTTTTFTLSNGSGYVEVLDTFI